MFGTHNYWIYKSCFQNTIKFKIFKKMTSLTDSIDNGQVLGIYLLGSTMTTRDKNAKFITSYWKFSICIRNIFDIH